VKFFKKLPWRLEFVSRAVINPADDEREIIFCPRMFLSLHKSDGMNVGVRDLDNRVHASSGIVVRNSSEALQGQI